MTRSFAVTWDYRCPFARNVHEHLLAGLEAGADWEIRFLAFSLDQAHVEDGGAAVWEEPDRYPGLVANLAGIAVRDRMPGKFPAVHRALFSARHDHALDLRDRSVLGAVLEAAGVDGTEVLAEVDRGRPLEVLAAEHAGAARNHGVFGVPTFIVGDKAAFVRLMNRPGRNPKEAVATIDRVLDMLEGWPDLNELKHTRAQR